jgi:hypothetical protein
MKVAIGARASTNGKPEFHAWLEQAGETLGDSQTLTQAYVRLGMNSETRWKATVSTGHLSRKL